MRIGQTLYAPPILSGITLLFWAELFDYHVQSPGGLDLPHSHLSLRLGNQTILDIRLLHPTVSQSIEVQALDVRAMCKRSFRHNRHSLRLHYIDEKEHQDFQLSP
jgi:hypothetical protein